MTIIDTYKVITALEKTGLKEEQAREIAEAINSAEEAQGLATKADISRLETKLTVVGAGVGILVIELILKLI